MSLLEQFQHGRHYSALRDIVREGKALNQIARDASELELTALQHVAESAESSAAQHEAATMAVEEMTELLAVCFTTMIQHLNAQTERLAEIVQRLEEPARSRAREKQRDAVRAYSHGWIGEAITDFEAAVQIDRYDYVSWWFLAVLYTFSKMDDERARTAFEFAARYSWPENPTTSAAACLGLAFVEYANGRLQRAAEAAATAVQRDPKLAVGHYDLARYLALQGNCGPAIGYLRTAIKLDPKFYNLAAIDPDFKGC